MLPTVDVCFAGLMENPVVRKGFCAAVLRVSPEEVRETALLPTHLHRDYADEKLGILDVRVQMSDGVLINMEMQVRYFAFWDERALFYLSKMFSGQLKSGEPYENLKKCIHVSILDFVHFPEDTRYCRTIHFRDETGELYSNKLELQILESNKECASAHSCAERGRLRHITSSRECASPPEGFYYIGNGVFLYHKKLPAGLQTGKEILRWMQFFNGKNREEFKRMATANEYLGEAYEALEKLSADDRKRIEYEEREKALKDYNTQMKNARECGEKAGEERGRRIGEETARRVFKLHIAGKPDEAIAEECSLTIEKVRSILA